MEKSTLVSSLEARFQKFRNNTIGTNASFRTPYGEQPLVYADWIASGRLYEPIENKIKNEFGPYVANTHSESSFTGKMMTQAYHAAHQAIKKHVNANENDVIITPGTGMTGALAKLQRIMGFRLPEQYLKNIDLSEEDRPVVFITHMEHHSNQTSWLESIADSVIIPFGDDLLVDVEKFKNTISQYADRKTKIGCFTACSNVTGIRTPYHQLAKIMHQNDGICLVDFAASAPYDAIDMHPADPEEALDGIFFSPHKFLGGPGSSGVLIFNKALYKNQIHDQPGGGTVKWTNPWGGHSYFEDVEVREDGGTPGFIQAIRTALCIQLKEDMGVEYIHLREQELLETAFSSLRNIPGLNILADNVEDRLGVISFYVDNIHYNLLVAILNDRYGIQVRGGCSCAGTYGHLLLHVTEETSNAITSHIELGDLTDKPGWIRLSLHPTMTNEELDYVLKAISDVVENIESWEQDYTFDVHNGEFFNKLVDDQKNKTDWFSLDN